MFKGIFGRKVGMTQVYDAEGNIATVTVVAAEPCVVVQTKRADGPDGYEAIVVGFGEAKKPIKPHEGRFKKLGLPMEAGVFNQFSDQVSRVEEKDDHFLYYIDRCPVCWGRKTDKPVCYAATGLLQESLRWLSGGKEFRIDETSCIGVGDTSCTFKIYKEPIG